MKKIFTLIAGLFLFSAGINAQSFTIADTVRSTPVCSVTVLDPVTNTSTVSDTITWKVVACDFPSDWNQLFSICDNFTCISNGPPTANTLWPTATSHTSMAYMPSATGDFHMIVDLTTATTNGTHYVTVRLNNASVPADTALTTFVITKGSTGVQYFPRSSDDIVFYPNPAHDEINVVYSTASDVKNISIYNIIGKLLAVYKVTDSNSANLNLENIPSGIYFARLMNSQGNVVCTRKFTKQ